MYLARPREENLAVLIVPQDADNRFGLRIIIEINLLHHLYRIAPVVFEDYSRNLLYLARAVRERGVVRIPKNGHVT